MCISPQIGAHSYVKLKKELKQSYRYFAVLHIVMQNRCHLSSFQPSTIRCFLIAPADSQVEKIKVAFRTYSLLDIDLSIRNKGLKPTSPLYTQLNKSTDAHAAQHRSEL